MTCHDNVDNGDQFVNRSSCHHITHELVENTFHNFMNQNISKIISKHNLFWENFPLMIIFISDILTMKKILINILNIFLNTLPLLLIPSVYSGSAATRGDCRSEEGLLIAHVHTHDLWVLQ